MMHLHYDFQVSEGMDPVVGLLHAMVKYNFERLQSAVVGITQEEIDYRGPNHDQNSIAQQIRHLAVVDLHWVYRLLGTDFPEEMKDHFGPMYDEDGKLPLVNNIPLATLLEEYDHIQQLFKEACLQLTDQDLFRTVRFGIENEKTATIRWGIWHIADHSRHHFSSIVRMKKLAAKEL